jgi:site-specific recombinase XerD
VACASRGGVVQGRQLSPGRIQPLRNLRVRLSQPEQLRDLCVLLAPVTIACTSAVPAITASAGITISTAERGPRTLAVTRRGGKRALIPLAPRTARAIDLAIGERCEEPIFTTVAWERLDRPGAGRIVRRVARRAGLAKKIGPHTLRHAFITAALDVNRRGSPLGSLGDPGLCL